MAEKSIVLIGLSALWLGACHGDQASAPNAPRSSDLSPSAAPAATAAGSVAAPSGSPAAPAEKGAPRVWTFDSGKAGEPPAGFSFGRTGGGKPGSWLVKAEPGAPSGANVLAQLDADGTDHRFPVAVANEPPLRDVRLSVRCKPISGSVDQACGLVFRYRDESNYYVTRANALENNVRLYHVKDGNRKQFESWSGPVTGKTWHELRVDAREDHFEVYWDGKKIIDGHDKTFPDAGKVGVWTKADSVTYFDDLSASPL
jgi:hypothetical protein